jgi:hypothetical protein
MGRLSRRERFLIFITLFFIPPILIYVLLIAPLQTQLFSNRLLLDDLESSRIRVNANLTAIPTYRLRKEARVEDVEVHLNEFSSPIHEAEFERWMLPLLTKYKVNVQEVILSDTRIATPMVPIVPVPRPIYRLLELIVDYNRINPYPSLNVPSSSTQLLFAEYTYNFISSYETYAMILDEIKAWDTTFIVSETNYIFADREASITVQVYSVHKLSPEQILEIYMSDFGIHPNEMKGPSVPDDPK